MSETTKRTEALRLVMSKAQREEYYGLVGVVASRYDNDKVSPMQDLHIAERVVCGKPVDVDEVTTMRLTKSALEAIEAQKRLSQPQP